MYRSLSSIVPNAVDLLSLEVEELAGVLLIHLNSFGGVSVNAVGQQNDLSHHNFFNGLSPTSPYTSPPEYGDKQSEIIQALMEAWAWLQSAGLLVERASSSPGWFFLSRRAKQISSLADFDAYQKANLLPKSQIHPLIASKVYPAFLRGEYDTAIFQAFREVEVAVRDAGRFSTSDSGADLMRSAFRPVKNGTTGPLTDQQLPPGEQDAMGHLFAGAFGLYRNSTAHRYVPTTAEEAAEVIMFASQLLRIVDRRRP